MEWSRFPWTFRVVVWILIGGIHLIGSGKLPYFKKLFMMCIA